MNNEPVSQKPSSEPDVSASIPVPTSADVAIIAEDHPATSPDVKDESIESMGRIKALRRLGASLQNAVNAAMQLKQMTESAATFELGRLHLSLGLHVQQPVAVNPAAYTHFTDVAMPETLAALQGALAQIEAERQLLIDHPPTFEQPATDPTDVALAEASELLFGSNCTAGRESMRAATPHNRHSYGFGYFSTPNRPYFSTPNRPSWAANLPTYRPFHPVPEMQETPTNLQGGDLILRTAGVVAYGRPLPDGRFMLLAGSFINQMNRSPGMDFDSMHLPDVDRYWKSCVRLRQDLPFVNADVARSVVVGNTTNTSPWTDCDGEPYTFTGHTYDKPQIHAMRSGLERFPRPVPSGRSDHPTASCLEVPDGVQEDDLALEVARYTLSLQSGKGSFYAQCHVRNDERIVLEMGSVLQHLDREAGLELQAVFGDQVIMFRDDGTVVLKCSVTLPHGGDFRRAAQLVTGMFDPPVEWTPIKDAISSQSSMVETPVGETEYVFNKDDAPQYVLSSENSESPYSATCWVGNYGRVLLSQNSAVNRLCRNTDLGLQDVFASGEVEYLDKGLAVLTRDVHLPVSDGLHRAAQIVTGRLDTDAQWTLVTPDAPPSS